MRAISGFGGLIRLILRLDRTYLLFWVLGLVALAVFFAPLMPDFLSDSQSAAALAKMMKNPTLVALVGVSYGNGIGAQFSLLMLVWSTLAAAVFNIFFAVRHTRKDEEQGRDEILGSLPLGRNANLFAMLVVAFFANALIAALTIACLAFFGVQGIDVDGAIVYGTALGAGGFFFAALTALFSQIFSSSKGTYILAFIFLGASYVLRAYGDMASGPEIAALISPLGLVERVQAWVSNETWPIMLLLVESVFLIIVAFILSSIRDNGRGLLPVRKGRSHASPLLRGEWSLAWRLTRSIFFGWIITMFVLGALYGGVLNSTSTFMQSDLMYDTIIGSNSHAADQILETFIAFLMLLMAVLSAVPSCMIIFKMKNEEKRGRTEQVLARPVSRVRYMMGFLLIAVVLAVLLLLSTPLGMYSTAVFTMKNPPELSMLLQSSLNFLPAVLVIIGLAAFLVAALPRITSFTWVYLVFCFLMAYLGNIVNTLNLSQQATLAFDILHMATPFSLLPLWPVEDFNSVLAFGMVGVAFVCIVLGLIAYRSRSIKGG